MDPNLSLGDAVQDLCTVVLNHADYAAPTGQHEVGIVQTLQTRTKSEMKDLDDDVGIDDLSELCTISFCNPFEADRDVHEKNIL